MPSGNIGGETSPGSAVAGGAGPVGVSGSTAEGADARFELATAAATAARANRPTMLIVVAAALLAVAMIAAAVSLTGRLAAERRLVSERGRAQELVNLAARLKQLDEAAAASGGKRAGRISGLPTTLNQLARTAGLRSDPSLKNLPPYRTGDVVRNKIEYEVRDESLEAVLRWIDQATRQVQGLEVFSLNVKPEGQNWHVKVTFSWWENQSAAR